MPQVITITSGKGGVGKTTTSASISTGLANKGHKTVVIDFDVGLRNLDLIMGCERRVVYDFTDVIEGKATLDQALIKDKREKNLYILAASQTKDKDSLNQKGVEKVIEELKTMGFEYIVCDSPAGIETGALMAMYYADIAIIVSNPEISSIRDSDRVIGLLDGKTLRAKNGTDVKKYLLITRYSQERVDSQEMLSIEDINDILQIDLLGVVTESKTVLNASNKGIPVILDETSPVSKCYKDAIDRILGNEVNLVIHEEKKSIFKKIFGGK